MFLILFSSSSIALSLSSIVGLLLELDSIYASLCLPAFLCVGVFPLPLLWLCVSDFPLPICTRVGATPSGPFLLTTGSAISSLFSPERSGVSSRLDRSYTRHGAREGSLSFSCSFNARLVASSLIPGAGLVAACPVSGLVSFPFH
jgi:hypothetical protein